ncbi:hypothetical protein RND71_021982 [Anisodus tanguticus]|uniref:aspartyl aminopeptidase n=1 Tax=Anisodus tanguticus TaxID=243964 RepID=A0AAE1V7T2_9SOLA|nr:hypothetical protein RND71_021982 [Anisodus tanguticus]
MAANAIARFQFLQPYPFSSKFPLSIINNINPRRIHFRNFSATSPPLCSSSSDSIPESPEGFESSPSIVGDLLDYLNESWTQFHATGIFMKQTAQLNKLGERSKLVPGHGSGDVIKQLHTCYNRIDSRAKMIEAKGVRNVGVKSGLLVAIDDLRAEAKRQLIAAGFHLLKENEQWDLQPGGRYFFTRNMSSLVAFAIGTK